MRKEVKDAPLKTRQRKNRQWKSKKVEKKRSKKAERKEQEIEDDEDQERIIYKEESSEHSIQSSDGGNLNSLRNKYYLKI